MKMYFCEFFSLELIGENFENALENFRQNLKNLPSQKCDHPANITLCYFPNICSRSSFCTDGRNLDLLVAEAWFLYDCSAIMKSGDQSKCVHIVKM